jgi:uroporphyrinogen III methyltransferase/synthase
MTAGKVYLVGAGPGSPGLLTLRAVECLQQADVVLHDKLVPPAMLEHAPESAARICVTELGALHVERYVPVQSAMIELARQGKCVVRLKGGDPFLFGRGAEEAEALRRAGIPFEVVPGVTAALGAAACAGIPLTHRAHASAVAFVTGHEQHDKSESFLDWDALARFPGTLVIYMGMSRLGEIAATLVSRGKPADTPAAVIQWAATSGQRTVESPLRDLAGAATAAGLAAPAVVIIGAVVQLRKHIAWFEQRALFGKRILVTRPRHQAGDLAHRLELLGAQTFILPCVEIRPPEDWAPVDRALQQLSQYHWLVLTSANGVHALITRLGHLGLDLRALGHLRLAAIGPKTAEALRSYRLTPDLVPEKFQSEDLARALLENIQPGQRILLARADRGRELLRDELARVARVDPIAVYSQVDTVEFDADILERLRQGEIDYITLTSSNIARSLIRALDRAALANLTSGKVRLVSLSPVTSAAVRELGLDSAEAPAATTDSLIDTLVSLAHGSRA